MTLNFHDLYTLDLCLLKLYCVCFRNLDCSRKQRKDNMQFLSIFKLICKLTSNYWILNSCCSWNHNDNPKTYLCHPSCAGFFLMKVSSYFDIIFLTIPLLPSKWYFEFWCHFNILVLFCCKGGWKKILERGRKGSVPYQKWRRGGGLSWSPCRRSRNSAASAGIRWTWSSSGSSVCGSFLREIIVSLSNTAYCRFLIKHKELVSE